MNPQLVSVVSQAFAAAYGQAPRCLVQAPGRVNLIGDHTDYNDGFVLPCAIDCGTVIAANPRTDMRVRVLATDYPGESDEFQLDEPIVFRADALWPNYVRGVVKFLLAHGLPLRGADLALTGDIPQGAGLSSSASLEVALAQAFKSLQGFDHLSPSDMALIGQRAENHFVGCNCGIMDQLISACGVANKALLIDCRSLQTTPVAMPEDVTIMIVHSRVKRGLVDSEYNTRRMQCETAARHFGIRALRDLDLQTLRARASELDPLVYRRALHVVTENQRTLDAAAALAVGDLPQMGRLMAQAHESIRCDFETSVPAVDQLVHILQAAIGDAGGARMTGGGFGGCVVALMPNDKVAEVRATVLRDYRSPSGEPGIVYLCKASDGAGPLN